MRASEREEERKKDLAVQVCCEPILAEERAVDSTRTRSLESHTPGGEVLHEEVQGFFQNTGTQAALRKGTYIVYLGFVVLGSSRKEES